MENEFFNDLDGMVFVQPEGPGHPTYPLLCGDVDALANPYGGVTTRLCQTAQGGWRTTSRGQGGPSAATFTIETWLGKTRSWLQKAAGRSRRCPVSFYIHHQECPPADLFLNYTVGQAQRHGIITASPKANMVRRRGDEAQAATPVGHSFEVNALPEPPEYWKLVHTRRAIAEGEALRDVAFCDYEQCPGSCGTLAWPCEDGVAVANAATQAKANVWFTEDGGATWAAATAQPFATDADIPSVVCFHTAPHDVRHVVARGTTDVGPMDVSYTDDRGDSWNGVPVGAVNGEFALHSGALCALDHYHMWLVTNLGNCYFSGDAGASWVDQQAPDPAAGLEEMNYVRFLDTRYGWIAGDNNQCWYSTDGGKHWALVTGPEALADLTCVAPLTGLRAFVGGELTGQGHLWLTEDGGASWTDYLDRLAAAENFPGGSAQITGIGDVMFVDEFCGAVTGCKHDGDENYKGTWVTRNGGWDWEFYYDPDDALDAAEQHYTGNAVWVCDWNHAYSVGEVSAATALVEELSAKGGV